MNIRTHKVTVPELVDLLVEQGLLTAEQAQEVNVRAGSAEARLRLAARNKGGARGAGGEISPAEVIGSLELPEGGVEGAAVLDEDRV